MAAIDKYFCSLCPDVGTFTEAVTWCTECVVFLCRDCEKHHQGSGMLKTHKTISKNDYHTLSSTFIPHLVYLYRNIPECMQKVSSQCRDHEKTFELYCSFHACPCCRQCVTDKHQKCHEIKPIADILMPVKLSASVKKIDKNLKILHENIDKITEYLKGRIISNYDQKTKAIEEIQAMRKSIDDYLNKLEEKYLDDLESKHSKLKSQINTLLVQMKQQADHIAQLKNKFSKMTQYGTELQLFIGLQGLEKTTCEAGKNIEDLENEGHFNEKNIVANISSALEPILRDVKSFGVAVICHKSSKLQVQYLVPEVPGMDQIKPVFLKTLKMPESMKNIHKYACRILPDGKFILIENNIEKSLILFSNEGIFLRKVVALAGDPYNVCFVKNNTVAVGLGTKPQTVLVDIEQNKITEIINLSHRCDCVACDGQILVISSRFKSTILNLNDKSFTDLEGVGGTFISLFKDNIYSTVFDDNRVSCNRNNGELLWSFQHRNIEPITSELTLDKAGFVYVASSGNNSIVVVSPDGQTSKTLLSEGDGISDPVAIDINKETGKMIVLSETKDPMDKRAYQTVFVYEINLKCELEDRK